MLIPDAVSQDIRRARAIADAAPLQVAAYARSEGGLQVATAGNRPLVTQLETVLDAGEADAIAPRLGGTNVFCGYIVLPLDLLGSHVASETTDYRAD